MKKFKLPLILGAIALVAFLIIKTASALNLYYQQSSPRGTVASTTASFMIGGTSTTTKTIATDGYEQLSFFVAIGSSTTPPTLTWKIEHSNNATDWYGEDQTYASSTIHTQATRTDSWKAATSSDSTILSRGTDGKTLFVGRKIVIPNLDSQYTRVSFSIGAGERAMLDIHSSLKNEVVLTK